MSTTVCLALPLHLLLPATPAETGSGHPLAVCPRQDRQGSDAGQTAGRVRLGVWPVAGDAGGRG